MNWSEEQDEMIVDLRKRGVSWANVAAELGRSVPACRFRLDRIRKGLNRAEYAIPACSPEEDAAIVEMHDAGNTFLKIAQTIGKTVTTVRRRYNKVTGLDCGADKWPPTEDKWVLKVNFAEHNLKIRPTRTVIKNTDHSNVRSLVGNSSKMCVS